MVRCRHPVRVLAIAVLLVATLCLVIDYLLDGGEPHHSHAAKHVADSRDTLTFVHLPSSAMSPTEPIQKDIKQNADNAIPVVEEKGNVNKISLSHLPPSKVSLSPEAIEQVQTFTFFIGYPRSGHSVIASMIDAHPNAIIAHEFNLFSKLAAQLSVGKHQLLNRTNLFNALYRDSYKEATSGWRSGVGAYDKKGYSLKLNGSELWQGRFTALKVIGDKAGGSTARAFRDKPDLYRWIYRSLSEILDMPIHVIHVVRNPFDMIATRLLYRLSDVKRQKALFNSTNKLKDNHVISQAFNGLYGEAKAVHDMISECDLTVLEIHHTDFVHDTREQMRLTCRFLGLKCSESYLDACEEMAYKRVVRTRDALDWSEEMKANVTKKLIRGFPFFNRYSFENE